MKSILKAFIHPSVEDISVLKKALFAQGVNDVEIVDSWFKLDLRDGERVICIDESIHPHELYNFISFANEYHHCPVFTGTYCKNEGQEFFKVKGKEIASYGKQDKTCFDGLTLSRICVFDGDDFKKYGIHHLEDNVESFIGQPIFPLSGKIHDGPLRPTLFLDRDGVLMKDNNYVYKKEDVELLEEIVPVLNWAKEKDFLIIVLTNQSGVARGMFETDDVEKLHEYIQAEYEKLGVSIDGWIYAPTHPKGKVERFTGESLYRKPGVAMLLEAARNYPVDLAKSYMIGDSLTDHLDYSPLHVLHINYAKKITEAKAPIFSNYKDLLKHLDREYKHEKSSLM